MHFEVDSSCWLRRVLNIVGGYFIFPFSSVFPGTKQRFRLKKVNYNVSSNDCYRSKEGLIGNLTFVY